MAGQEEEEAVGVEEHFVEKDLRKVRKINKEKRVHHTCCGIIGPDIVLKKEESFREPKTSTDAFDIKFDDVPYSINKNKRWQKIENAEEVLINQNSSGKLSYVSASIPSTHSTTFLFTTCDKLIDSVRPCHGGVNEYIEVENNEVIKRTAKSNRASLQSLESTLGPENRPKRRQHTRLKKEEVDSDDDSHDSEKAHTRYTKVSVQPTGPKGVERSWRSGQGGRKVKYSQKRLNMDIEDEYFDYFSDQDNYECKMDGTFEDQIDTIGPLKQPKWLKDTIKKKSHAAVVKKEEKKVDEPKMNKQEKKAKAAMKATLREQRVTLTSLRDPLISSNMNEAIMDRARVWMKQDGRKEFLEISPPIAIIHKDQSEEVLGVQMNRCTFVTERDNDVVLYTAPIFCCTERRKNESLDGWTAHLMEDEEYIGTTHDRPSTSDLLECPLCKNSASCIEEDTVVIKRIPLYGMSCGHIACDTCWLDHCKKSIKDGDIKISCIKDKCSEILSISRGCGFLSDSTLSIIRDIAYEKVCDTVDAVKCSSCHLLLTPNQKVVFGPLCPCGARTCRSCGDREHLPLTCEDYYKWKQFFQRNMISAPRNLRYYYVNNRPDESLIKLFMTCPKCHIPDAKEFKHWCDVCGSGLRLCKGDGLAISMEQLIECLKYRGRMMNGTFRKMISELRANDEKQADMFCKKVEEAVYFYEMITVRKFLGTERGFTKTVSKVARDRINAMESSLSGELFHTFQVKRFVNTKIERLDEIFKKIRNEYVPYL